MFERDDRTKPYLIRYICSLYLYLYFHRSSLRKTSRALEPFVERIYVAIWYWMIQKFDPKHHLYPNKKKSMEYLCICNRLNSTTQIGPNEAWLWL